MDLAILKTELDTDPLNRGYAAMLQHGTGDLPGVLNKPDRDIVVTKWLTDRGMASEIVPVHGVGFCDALFDKFDELAQASITVKRMVNRLYTDPQGLNFGDDGLRAMFTGWLQVQAITQAQADALLSLGIGKGSRAQEILGQNVTEIDIQNALEL